MLFIKIYPYKYMLHLHTYVDTTKYQRKQQIEAIIFNRIHIIIS